MCWEITVQAPFDQSAVMYYIQAERNFLMGSIFQGKFTVLHMRDDTEYEFLAFENYCKGCK